VDAGPLTGVQQPAAGPRLAAVWRGIALRAEDLLLAGWVAVAAPILVQAGGSAGPFETGQPLIGLLQLGGFCGAIVCLGTRNPEPRDVPSTTAIPSEPVSRFALPAAASSTDTAKQGVLNSAAVGPLIGGLLLVGGSGFAQLGLDPEIVFGPTMVVVIALTLLQSHLPQLPTPVRRTLVTPYLLSAGGIFWAVVHAVAGSFDFAGGPGMSLTGISTDVAGAFGLLALCAAVYYAMLIYAPRQVAEREGGPIVWIARFALFLVSVTFGLGWLSLLGG
jgi:hypothetical protein